MVLVLVALVAIFVSLFYVYLTWNFDYWRKRGVIGPKPMPLLGTFPQSTLLRKNLLYEIDELYRKYRGKAPFIGVFLHRTPQLLVIDAQLIKRIYVSDFKSFHMNDFSQLIDQKNDPLFYQNPFILGGDEWKNSRSELTTAFTPPKVKPMYPIITDICDKMRQFIERHMDEPLNAKDITTRYTADTISNCVFGMDSNCFGEESSEFLEVSRRVFETSFMTYLYLTVTSVFPFLLNFYKRPLIKKTFEKWFLDFTAHSMDVRERVGHRDDFLQFLLQQKAKKNLSLVDVTAHTITFFLDGYETSSIVLAHALHQLAKNKDVQEKLREEIKSFGEINFDNINDLPYLDMVFNETLRIMPTAFLTAKVCNQDVDFMDSSGIPARVEAGTTVHIPVYTLHHDAEYWPNPHQFDPERFDESNGGVKAFKDQGIFMPFGNGPRLCLGMRFAYPQVKSALVEIIRNFDMTLNPKTPKDIVVEPINFLYFSVTDIFIDFKKIN